MAFEYHQATTEYVYINQTMFIWLRDVMMVYIMPSWVAGVISSANATYLGELLLICLLICQASL